MSNRDNNTNDLHLRSGDVEHPMSSTPVGYAQSVLHVYFTPVGTVSPKDFPVRVNTHVHHAGGTVLLKDQSHQANHLLTRACTMFTQITLVTFDVTRQ